MLAPRNDMMVTFRFFDTTLPYTSIKRRLQLMQMALERIPEESSDQFVWSDSSSPTRHSLTHSLTSCKRSSFLDEEHA